MHVVIQNILLLHRSEGSESDVKCYMRDLYSLCLDLLKKLCCKMQSGGRCCRRTVMLCINCLIPVLILKLVCDIWWERHLSQLVKNLLEYSIELKSDESVALLNYINDLTHKFALYKSCLRVRFI